MPNGIRIVDIHENGNTYRICSKCGTKLLLNNQNFPANKKQPTGLRAECKKCWNLKTKIYRENLNEAGLLKMNKRIRAYKEKNRDKIRVDSVKHYKKVKDNPALKEKRNLKAKERTVALKKEWMTEVVNRGFDSCYYCGFNECFNAIDFHHINTQDKEMNVARMFIRKPTPKRLMELDKCIPLCSNHHRMLHAGYITIEEIMRRHEEL